MSFTVHDVEQLSDEWFELRLGKLSSSRAADMLATKKSAGEAAARRNLRVKLVLERITGKIEDDGWTSKPMQRGIDKEPEALNAYEAETGNLVRRVGLVTLNDLPVAASPDGIVGDFEGVVEAKCPLAATHLGYLKTGKIPGNYMAQIAHLLWVTGAEWCDWFSYHPDFPEDIRVQLVRVDRDEADVDGYEAKAREFLSEVDVEEQLVRDRKFGEAHAA